MSCRESQDVNKSISFFTALPVRRIFCAALLPAFLLGGCANMNLQKSAAPVAAKPPEMSASAQREHQRIVASYGGVYHEPKTAALLKLITEKLVAVSDRPELRYRVTILNSATVNAFALPSGNLYVTRGLIALANDTAELASVLAHEVAHVTLRHAAIREDQARQAALAGRAVSDAVNDPQASALALAKSKLTLASFSRAQEFEADVAGVTLAARAGYDPTGAVRFLAAMGRDAELRPSGISDPRLMAFALSHPSTPERVDNVRQSAKQQNADTGERDRVAYQQAVAGLTFGEDPHDGILRAGRFVHPRLGFAFTAPKGFTVETTSQAVLGVKDNDGHALRLDVVQVPAEQSASTYLNSGWIENLDPGSIAEVNVNGMRGASATARSDSWTFRIYVVGNGNEMFRFIFAAKDISADAERDFHEAVVSFRRLSPSESRNVKPLRLRFWTVRPGDKPERFVAKMALPDRALERFLLLNGLEPGQPLVPGDKVKVVAE